MISVNATTQQIGAWIARIGSVALVVLSAISSDSVPSNVRPYLAIAGAIILAVDRYVTDPTTGTPVAKPTPPPAPAPPPAPGP